MASKTNRKKIDSRIRVLIENGVHLGHRSMFCLVGDKGRDQVVILHHILSKAEVKTRPNVLWCYKSELGFSSHRKKRMRQLQKKIRSGQIAINEDDPFELFVASTNIRYCYYSETQKILGNTFGMCVLQDFEAITPNILARTIETVEGGGIIVVLLRSVESLKQLYTMNMDVHSRFRTESHQDVVGRFNERFILSLASCEGCIVLDDSLHVLPLSCNVSSLITASPLEGKGGPKDIELNELKENLRDSQPIGVIVNCCKTVDQAKALLRFVDVLSEKKLQVTVSLTAARGRGKSAAMGLSIASAIAFGYTNIYVTSPTPENLNTLFEFVLKGFDVLEYREHSHYSLTQSSDPEFGKAIVRIDVFHDRRQTIQYILPTESMKLGHAELLIIDEAAAIPLPILKSLFGPHMIFLASTINGYEGTGRSLSLKLLDEVQHHSRSVADKKPTDESALTGSTTEGRMVYKLTLEESIRYKPGDKIENWLTNLLCLDATLTEPLQAGCPPPKYCELYYINRDTLFCYHKASELFLQKIMSLYVASHYKNSPNDLQILSDAPAHHLFCLLGPVEKDKKEIPDVICVVQVCLEGEISKESINEGLRRGKRAAGDLIPWTVAQQYQDQGFPSLSGARIVRIATHPDYQGMGYGSRAIEQLQQYYEMKIINIDECSKITENIERVEDETIGLLQETIAPRKNLPPLLLKLSERPPEVLHYLGVSYGLTMPLLKFWKRAGFIPVYLRQTCNDLTGEHSAIMLKILENGATKELETSWLNEFWIDFRRRFISLLSYKFRTFKASLALSVLQNKNVTVDSSVDISPLELQIQVTSYDMKRLELYTKNMADYHLIMDLVPILSKLYFLNKLGTTSISTVQSAILLGVGLQHKTVDELSKDLDLAGTQILGLFNRTMRKILDYLNKVLENNLESQMDMYDASKAANMLPVAESLSKEMDEAAKELGKKQAKELNRLKKDDLSQYAIKGSESDWSQALTIGSKSIPKLSVSVKTGDKRIATNDTEYSIKTNKKDKSFGKGWKKLKKGN